MCRIPGVWEGERVGDFGRRIVACRGPAGLGIVISFVAMVDSLPWRVLGRVKMGAIAAR